MNDYEIDDATREVFTRTKVSTAHSQALGIGKQGWPKGVKPVSVDSLEFLGFDENGRLYWDGKKLEVEKKITLSCLQIIYGFVIMFSTLALPLIEIYKLWKHIP